jgi:hypothetical protein
MSDLQDVVLNVQTYDSDLYRRAAAELAYLEACAAAVEDLSRIDATDATIAMFFKRDAKRLMKLRPGKEATK